MAGDITISIGGKSTTQPAVDKSIGDLNRLSGSIKGIGSQMRSLKQLGGFAIGARMFTGLIGDLDQVSERLGGKMGADVAKLDEGFKRLQASAQGFADTLIGETAPAMNKLVGVWQGLLDAMPRSGITGAQGAFETKVAGGAMGLDQKTLEDQLKFQQKKADEAGKLMADALKEKSRIAPGEGNMDFLLGPFGGIVGPWLREQGIGDKLDQLNKQQTAGEKALADAKKAIDDIKVAIGIRGPLSAAKPVDAAPANGKGLDAAVPKIVIRGFDDKEETARFNIAAGIDRVKREDAEAKQEAADRLRAMLAPAPGLVPQEARFLTRGRGGPNVDPEHQAFYAAKMGALGKGGAGGKNDPQMEKNNKLLEAIAKAMQKLSQQGAKGVF